MFEYMKVLSSDMFFIIFIKFFVSFCIIHLAVEGKLFLKRLILTLNICFTSE